MRYESLALSEETCHLAGRSSQQDHAHMEDLPLRTDQRKEEQKGREDCSDDGGEAKVSSLSVIVLLKM